MEQKIKTTERKSTRKLRTFILSSLSIFILLGLLFGINELMYKKNLHISTNNPILEQVVQIPRKPFGIFKESEGSGFLDSNIGNEWHGMVDNKYFELFAGSVRDNPKQGNIILVIEKSEIPYSDEKSGIKNTNGSLNYGYLTPSKHGSVEIIKEIDGKISLKAKDGTIFVFDIRNRSYSKKQV